MLAIAAMAAAVALALYYLSRENPQRLLREGEALLDRDPRQAGEVLERSLAAAGGDYPDAQLLLCQALGKQGRWIEALGCFSLIEDKSALDGRRLMELSAAAMAGGEPILAEQALEAALATAAPAGEVLQALLPVRLALGHDEQALADCRRLAAIDPHLAAPHATEARLLRRRREILTATAAYRAALARTKDGAETAVLRRELVELLIQQGSVAEARREFDQLPSGQFDDADLALLRAYILRFEGRSREALRDVDGYLAVHPEHADALLLRGTLRFDLAEYQFAVADLRLLTEINPFHKEAHYLLGQALLKLGLAEEAKSHLETSRQLAAALEEIRTLEGQADRDPSDAQIQLRLAELCDATGQPEQAARWRQSAARQDAD